MSTETKRNSQDDQIQYLESQVEAYKAGISILQQQHLSALDALDEVRQSHTQELDRERTARVVAESRLQKYKNRVTEAESERDESKAAVLELIKQVERSRGDFKHWPRSKLSLSVNLDPLEHPVNNLTDQSFIEAEQDTLRISAVVDRLRRELSLERQAHTRTRNRANVLAAQIANRDAALERWTQHASTSPTLPVFPSNVHDVRRGKSKRVGHENLRDLDRGEIATLFEEIVMNNKSLEREVLMLSKTVEDAQRKAKSLYNEPVPKLPSVLTWLQGGPSEIASLNSTVQEDKRPGPSSRGYSSTSAYRAPSPNLQRGRSLSATRPLSRALTKASTSRSRAQSRQRSQPPPSESGPLLSASTETVVQRFSQQVDRLSVQIDAFCAERAALSGIIESQLHRSDGEEETVTPDMVERDPSLMDSFDDLDGETSFGDTELAGHGTEDERIIRQHIPPDEPDDVHDVGIGPVTGTAVGDVTDGGERSMEISTTPLFPTLMTFSDFASLTSGDDDAQVAQVETEHQPQQQDELEEVPGDDQIRMIRPRRLTPSPP